MIRRYSKIFFLIILLFSCTFYLFDFCFSQEAEIYPHTKGFGVEVNLETVFSVTRTVQPFQDVGTNVVVITQEEILMSRAKNVGEVLQNQLSILILKYGTIGSIQNLFLRGTPPQQVLVLIDGVTLNSPSSGLADLTQIPIDNVEKIEIVRGANSSLYGSNAIGGVVNIITRRAKNKIPETDIVISKGSLNTQNYRFSLGAKPNKASYFLSGSRIFNDGWRKNSDYKAHNINLNLGYDIDRLGKINITNQHYTDKVGIPGPSNIPFDQFNGSIERETSSPNARQEVRKNLTILDYQYPWRQSNFNIKTYLNDDKQIYRNPDWSIDDLRNILTKGIECQLDYNPNITIGTHYHHDRLNQRNENLKQDKIVASIFNGSAFGEFKITNNSLTYILGLRYDKYSSFGGQTSPRLSLIYTPLSNLKLSTNISKGFRTPTLNDIYWPYEEESFWGFTYITVGNANLKPEKAWSYDLGFEYSLGKKIIYKNTFFYLTTKDLIQWKQEILSPTVYRWQPQNVAQSYSRGVEVELKHYIIENISQNINYNFQEVRIKNNSNQGYKTLFFRPKHCLWWQLAYEDKQGLGINLETRFIDKQWEKDGEQGFKIPSYTLWNIQLSKKIFTAEFFFKVENILGKRYINSTDGFSNPYPLPGRTFWAGLNLKLFD